MVIRLGGGDLNAFVGLLGFVVGILVGVVVLKKGFSLKRAYNVGKAEGATLPMVMTGLLILFLAAPALFKFSEKGPGSMHAPTFVALIIALVCGALAQRARLCMVGGIRDLVMFKDAKLLYGFVAIFAVILVGNIALGNFSGFSTVSQPIAHSSHVWNFLGMVIVGWGSVLLGGCPLRQLILAGEGNADSAITVFGMIVGAAFAHNWGFAGGADSVAEDGAYVVGGISPKGQIAVVVILVLLAVISFVNIQKQAKAGE